MSVHRIFNPHLEDGSGRFHGRVQPRYHHKRVTLWKRSCASCGWHRVRHDRTSRRGHWRFEVGAPASGRFWWRASTPASARYTRSFSVVFTTQLR